MTDKIFSLGSPCAVVLAEFVRVVTRAKLAGWTLADQEDPGAGFSADLNVGSDIGIGVYRKGPRFVASIMWDPDGEPMLQPNAKGGADIYVPDQVAAAIDAELYAEVENAYRGEPRSNA
jgi:hypothetical protein